MVIALGGNALIREGETGAWTEQRRNALTAARAVAALRRAGHEVVLAHGNGPGGGARGAGGRRARPAWGAARRGPTRRVPRRGSRSGPPPLGPPPPPGCRGPRPPRARAGSGPWPP